MSAPAIDGWHYNVHDVPEGDGRKIVTLELDGMTWVGIRAFNHLTKKWQNNGEPETATVKAWRHLPEPARGYYARGIFFLPSHMLKEPQP